MRIGIFSDIHGNIYAFNKIFDSMKKKSIDLHIFCGDVCGYYYYQNEIIDILRELKHLYCVLGNHDKMFLDIMENKLTDELNTDKYGKANPLLKSKISRKNLTFLRSLPEKQIINIAGFKCAAFHGSPWDYLDEYVYPTDSLIKFKSLEYEYVFLGHTHYSMDKRADNIRIINPGSSGQPRDGRPPGYAILDLPSQHLEFINIEYDPQPLVRDILNYDECNSYLIEVLFRKGK